MVQYTNFPYTKSSTVNMNLSVLVNKNFGFNGQTSYINFQIPYGPNLKSLSYVEFSSTSTQISNVLNLILNINRVDVYKNSDNSLLTSLTTSTNSYGFIDFKINRTGKKYNMTSALTITNLYSYYDTLLISFNPPNVGNDETYLLKPNYTLQFKFDNSNNNALYGFSGSVGVAWNYSSSIKSNFNPSNACSYYTGFTDEQTLYPYSQTDNLSNYDSYIQNKTITNNTGIIAYDGLFQNLNVSNLNVVNSLNYLSCLYTNPCYDSGFFQVLASSSTTLDISSIYIIKTAYPNILTVQFQIIGDNRIFDISGQYDKYSIEITTNSSSSTILTIRTNTSVAYIYNSFLSRWSDYAGGMYRILLR